MLEICTALGLNTGPLQFSKIVIGSDVDAVLISWMSKNGPW